MSVSYCTLNGEFPGKRLKGAKRYEKLYHYTSFESFVKIWLNKTLRFSPVTGVNDIQWIRGLSRDPFASWPR